MMDTDGAALEALTDDRGVLAVPPGGYPSEIAALRARLVATRRRGDRLTRAAS